jgi:hypothetical protein
MLKNPVCIACPALCGVFLLTILLVAAPQDKVDREGYARDYVQFQVLELNQWTKGFPHDYNLAVMKPPVDAAKMNEAAKAGANDLRESVVKLSTLTGTRDLMNNADFRSQMDRTLAIAKQVNEAMGSQRFPMVLQADWDQIRGNLNNLARIYKLDSLTVLEPPGGGGRGGRGGRGAAAAAPAPIPAGAGLIGYVVDKQCATRGKGMWTNAECVARCVRDGDKVVLVTEEGKVYSIANPDKIEPDSYGQKLTLLGKTEGETITIESVK